MPAHAALGMGLFSAAAATAALGIGEKQTFLLVGKALDKFSFWATVINLAGVALVVLVICVCVALSRGAGAARGTASTPQMGTEQERQAMVPERISRTQSFKRAQAEKGDGDVL